MVQAYALLRRKEGSPFIAGFLVQWGPPIAVVCRKKFLFYYRTLRQKRRRLLLYLGVANAFIRKASEKALTDGGTDRLAPAIVVLGAITLAHACTEAPAVDAHGLQLLACALLSALLSSLNAFARSHFNHVSEGRSRWRGGRISDPRHSDNQQARVELHDNGRKGKMGRKGRQSPRSSCFLYTSCRQ